ncbi:hypothetical protein PH213_33625 [Streptomyces sp. SRF1]|uniref:hypothetical protein n=1 Tax=Streptomyces sp. SRF1 TaxID=1549642 RepID=UPI0025B276A7|nr:hypothetical protein [Streptomyces sp. SRF1]MDN3059391.1 hypothetical protein [Streptomyces sp. SRF1]
MSGTALLAGALDEAGTGWLDMLGRWADKGLPVALTWIVIIELVRRGSLKAGIGALLAMAIALGIYASKFSLAAIFEDEVKNPVKSAPAVSRVVDQVPPVGSSR